MVLVLEKHDSIRKLEILKKSVWDKKISANKISEQLCEILFKVSYLFGFLCSVPDGAFRGLGFNLLVTSFLRGFQLKLFPQESPSSTSHHSNQIIIFAQRKMIYEIESIKFDYLALEELILFCPSLLTSPK